jgi:uncharacterized repeat protein (TIGR03803 family)
MAGLIADGSGNLYGTTLSGGAFGRGLVFELSPPVPPALAWTETVLHDFCSSSSSASCSDGAGPVGGLIADRFGSLFGTTDAGGAFDRGVAFKLSPPPPGVTNWFLEVLHAFCRTRGCPDGEEPSAGLFADSNGTLYGTALGAVPVRGVVFELTDAGFSRRRYPFPTSPPGLKSTLTPTQPTTPFSSCPRSSSGPPAPG